MTVFLSNIRVFTHKHDDIPAFHAAYLVSTFLAAAILHLGFFAILIGIHMCLDYVKYRDFYRFSLLTTFRAIFLESLVDITLLCISLTFAIYLSHDFMLAAVSGLLRSELTVLRAFGTIIPRIRILEHFLTIFMNYHEYMHTVNPALCGSFTRFQKCSLFALMLTLALLAYSPVLYLGHSDALLNVIFREFSLGL